MTAGAGLALAPAEFCTYFDRHYLVRALAMRESLRAHMPRFRLWALCLDAESYATLARLMLPDVVPIRLGELEEVDPGLAAAKHNRTLVEYYFTCTPCLPLFLFDRNPEITQLTYLDADLFFLSDPSPIFAEVGSASVGIIEHRFPESLVRLEQAGRYNVGWLTFRCDAAGLACLQWWRARCLEACSDLPSGGRYADQKYLDEWPARFDGVIVIQHRGANVAPWNIANYRLRGGDGGPTVDGERLLFFHFHGLRDRGRGLYETGLGGYGVTASRLMMREIYLPYINALRRVGRETAVDGSPLAGRARAGGPPRERTGRVSAALRTAKDVLAGRYLMIWNGCLISTGR
jgi:hypothetical protein